MTENTNYAVGRTLRRGFDVFLVALAASIGVSLTHSPLRSSMVFLLLAPIAVSAASMVAYYTIHS